MKRKEFLVLLLISLMLTLIAGCAPSTPPVEYGSIYVYSFPDRAKVYLDGEDTGMFTPIVLSNVEVGIHTIKLDKFLYKIWGGDNNVTVIKDKTISLYCHLTHAFILHIILKPSPEEGKDAYVLSSYPNRNFGSEEELMVAYRNSTTGRIYIQFDLSAIPEGARVTDANLKLYQFGYGGLVGSFTVGLYQVTNKWREDIITYDNQPDSSTEPETTCNIQAHFSLETWNHIDALVQGWLDGIENYGMLLKATNEMSIDNSAGFRSSDYTYDTTKHPKLEIDYYIP